MNSSSKVPMIKPLSAEDIRQFIASKSIVIDEKTNRKIEAAFKPSRTGGKINHLINEFNTIRNAYGLLPGLTKKQRAELSRLVKQEQEFKQRHQQKQAKREDYKNFIETQHDILPLQQTIDWWNGNHESFVNDDFWKKISNTAKTQSKNQKEPEKSTRKRLHKLVNVKEDYNNYRAYYAYSSEDVNELYHNFILPLEKAVKDCALHHARQKKPYHAIIAEYLFSLLRTLENENKLIIYSMAYRLKCAEYFKNEACDDLMAYTLSRVYHHANIPKQDHKIVPAKRLGLTPEHVKLFCKLIQEYAKAHPDDALIQSKIEKLSGYFSPEKQAMKDKDKKSTRATVQQQPAKNTVATSTQHHSDLGHLILSIEDATNTIKNNNQINTGNISEFISQFEATILGTMEQLLSSNGSAFDFKTLFACSRALYSFLCPHIKGLILAANNNETDSNPHWFHLANHLGSRASMQDLTAAVSTQDTSPQFKEILRFSTHFSKVKHQLNFSIKSNLLKEANIPAPPNDVFSLHLYLQSQPLTNQQLLDFWSACAKKLKTNHITSCYDPIYALKMAKFLTQASDLIFIKSQDDHTLRENFIRMLPILNTIRTDINTCLKKQGGNQQFHYLFRNQMNADAVLKPVMNIIDKILALQLRYKLDSYIKNYANEQTRLAVLTTLRTSINEAIEGRQNPQSLPEKIDAVIKEAIENKATSSHRFNKSLQNFSTLSKRYFTGDNERIFTRHPEKICSLLG